MDSELSSVAFDALLDSLERQLGVGPAAEAAGLAMDRADARPYRRIRRRNARRAMRDLVELPLAELPPLSERAGRALPGRSGSGEAA